MTGRPILGRAGGELVGYIRGGVFTEGKSLQGGGNKLSSTTSVALKFLGLVNGYPLTSFIFVIFVRFMIL